MVGGGTAAVAHDQDAIVLLGREPSLFRLAAALSWRPANEPLRPLRRLGDEGLVRFHDARDSRRLRAFGGRQEPMPPTKRCLEMYADALCCLSQAQPVDDGAGILEPLLTLLQVRQRRAGESVEGAFAAFAHVALHARRHAPLAERLRAAMAARRRLGELGLNQLNDITS